MKQWGLARAARYEDRPGVSTGMAIYQRDRESVGPVVASAIAFRLFLFFVPSALFLVGLVGFLSGHVDAHDLSRTAGVSGGLADQIRAAVNQPDGTRWVATVLGLVGMATAGRSLSKVLVSASTVSWRLPVSNRAPIRVVGALVGLFSAIGLVAAAENRLRSQFGVGPASISFVAAFAIYGVAWLLISTLLPRATEDPGALLPGAAFVAGAITAMHAISQFYLPDRFERASQLYGAIGITVVTLAWFFILGRAISFAIVLNAVVYERVGTVSTFVFSLPVFRSMARRSARLRRFFDLDHTNAGPH